jgi:VanZ family protein
MGRGYSPRWLGIAVLASLALILSAPVIAQLSAMIRDLARGHYVLVLGLIVGAAALLALVSAVTVIRDRRRERYTAVALAIIVAGSYAFISRTGVADTDAAERFHFVEYGLLALLFYKAWRPSADGAAVVLPVLAGLLVGTIEEWVQWFVPARVGEAKDVILNLFSVVAGVLFAIGLDAAPHLTLRMSARSRRAAAVLGAVTAVTFAGFFHSVHLGHEIVDRDAGVFRSRYSAEELRTIGASRAERWKTQPPVTWSRYSREDQYLTEAVAHVRRRNQRWDEGNVLAARQENLILERYYAPVLDSPSFVSAVGHRWPAAQRAATEDIPGPGFVIYMSDALDYPVVTWPPLVYWLCVIAAILLTLRRVA